MLRIPLHMPRRLRLFSCLSRSWSGSTRGLPQPRLARLLPPLCSGPRLTRRSEVTAHAYPGNHQGHRPDFASPPLRHLTIALASPALLRHPCRRLHAGCQRDGAVCGARGRHVRLRAGHGAGVQVGACVLGGGGDAGGGGGVQGCLEKRGGGRGVGGRVGVSVVRMSVLHVLGMRCPIPARLSHHCTRPAARSPPRSFALGSDYLGLVITTPVPTPLVCPRAPCPAAAASRPTAGSRWRFAWASTRARWWAASWAAVCRGFTSSATQVCRRAGVGAGAGAGTTGAKADVGRLWLCGVALGVLLVRPVRA